MDSILGLRTHLGAAHAVPAFTPRNERLVVDARLLAGPSSTAVAHTDQTISRLGTLAGTRPSTRGSRRETRENMLAKGFITDFKTAGYGSLGSLFIGVLDGKVPSSIVHGTARALMQFETWATARTSTDPWTCITDQCRLTDYVESLRPVLRPASIRNYVCAIHRFLKALGVFPQLSIHVPPTVRPQIESATDCVRKLWNKSDRWRATFQRRRILAGDFTPVNLLAVRTYVSDRGVIARTKANLSSLEKHGLEGNAKIWSAVVSFLVAQVSEQGPRLCALQALRAREFTQARAVVGYMLIRIEEHKTEGSFGDAVIVLRNFEFELWLRYSQLRAKYFPGKVHFLLRADGTQITPKVLTPLNGWLAKEGERTANHTDIRKSVTIIDRQYNQNGEGRQTDGFLNHSRPVADANYYYRTDNARLAEWLATNDALEQSYLVALTRKPGILPKTPLASFPTRERVFSRLEPHRIVLGLIASEIKTHAWLIIRQEWRTKQFSSLIPLLIDRVRAVKPSGFPIHAVKTVVSQLDSVWAGECNNISNCLYKSCL